MIKNRLFPGVLLLILTVIVLAACGGGAEQEPAQSQNQAQEEASEAADVVTTASIVNTNQAFLQAISSDGTWIIATLKDLSFDQDLVLEGAFTNRDTPARKIALYTQDADRNVTARFTLSAPKLTVRSENARIQGGTFNGDVYVEAPNFLITDATVQGSVYFSSQEYRDSFQMTNGGAVTGELIVQ
ncbi:hypothetical protein [Spirochaeta lutea]|uniref:LPS export ABC transporter periplasmic protein LptC n=1 Tax=Spirochaeta lutea TaxID=1480694 RepID=A0A098QTN2_9SPIO|nr:hypothetical protein [Spirochaeta lutea]KGE70916.1 hypothetical protein DC28_13290 [Spirochaeta lutea]